MGPLQLYPFGEQRAKTSHATTLALLHRHTALENSSLGMLVEDHVQVSGFRVSGSQGYESDAL